MPVATVLGIDEADAAPWVRQDNTVRTWGNVMLIGDSTASGYLGHLIRSLNASDLGPYRCDLQAARSMHRPHRRYPSAVQAVRNARQQGFEPTAFVIAVGANDLRYGTRTRQAATTMFDTILTEIGSDRTVGICTIFANRPSGAIRFNRYLSEATQRWPQLHIINWAALARRHRPWHKPDGYHYTLTGARHRNDFLIAAMRNMAIIEWNRQNPPPTTTMTTSTTTTTTTTTTQAPGPA